MSQVVIFPTGDGKISIIYPTAASGLTVQEIAEKDVPAGLAYRIVNSSEIPADRSERDRWTADFSEPDGYGGE